MQREISKTAFKAQALEIMRGVQETGKDVVITAHGKKALRLVPYKDIAVNPREKLLGSVVKFDDPCSPVAEDDWEAV